MKNFVEMYIKSICGAINRVISWTRPALLVITLILIKPVGAQAGNTYYVSPNGSDSANGLSPNTAWSTCEKVNATPFSPGDTILFERGGLWRESLIPSSDGVANNPITYGAYGTGPKPAFYGSDLLPPGSWNLVSGTTSTYKIHVGTEVGWTFRDGAFLHSAGQLTRDAIPPTDSTYYNSTLNLAYVHDHPNTWYYNRDDGYLYVNTEGTNPNTDNHLYTAAVRAGIDGGAVFSNGRAHLVFENMVVAETAHWNGGYGLRVMASRNIIVQNIDSINGGKHHIGLINSTDILVENCTAVGGMPDTWYGAATAYVAFSDNSRVNDTSYWKNCIVENYGPGNGFPAFYTHGRGIGHIRIDNMISRNGGGSVVLPTEGTDETIVMTGGLIENSEITVWGKNVTIDGVMLTGNKAKIDLKGHNNLVQNCVISDSGHAGVISIEGKSNVVRFNTIVSKAHSTGMRVLSGGTDAELYGNIVVGTDKVLEFKVNDSQILTDWNFYPETPAFCLLDGSTITLAQWQAKGHDAHAKTGNPRFINEAQGDYRLAASSSAIDAAQIDSNEVGDLTDFLGTKRPVGAHYDIGAYEFKADTFNQPPAITIIKPDGTETVDTTYTIRWSDEDSDNDARISLYADIDNSGADGILLISNISEDDTTDAFTFDVSKAPEGSYYVYATIYDGVNLPITTYSTGPVTIEHLVAFLIQIDGEFDDWFAVDERLEYLGNDAVDSIAPSADLINAWAVYDNSYLYLGLEFKEAIDPQQTSYLVYIDIDENSTTGYAINGIGADVRFMNGTLESYTGPIWSPIEWDASYAHGKDLFSKYMEIAIYHASLLPNSPIFIVISAAQKNGTATDYMPNLGQGALKLPL
jgi:hypothetical protein